MVRHRHDRDDGIPPSPDYSQLLKVFAASVVIGGVVGSLTNFVHAMMSGDYFRIVLGSKFGTVFGYIFTAILRGSVEGLAWGVGFASVYAITILVITGCRGATAELMRGLLLCLCITLAGWIAGATVGFWWANASPTSYAAKFPPAARSSSLETFAFVGGGIWGLYAGAVIGAISACVWLFRHQKREIQRFGFQVKRAKLPKRSRG